LRNKLTEILAEYGPVAVVVYFGIFFTVLFGIWAAIILGWKPDSMTANMGSFAAAYLATKVTQPLRIASTLALTPLAARVYTRVAGRPLAQGRPPAPDDASTP
jgi:hypothetical protein